MILNGRVVSFIGSGGPVGIFGWRHVYFEKVPPSIVREASIHLS